jgi:hypothetical protein
MFNGWMCPLCGKVFAPWVRECFGPHTSPAYATTGGMPFVYADGTPGDAVGEEPCA